MFRIVMTAARRCGDRERAKGSAPSRRIMITIYHLGVSQSDRVVWLAEELGLPYQIEWFHRQADMLAPPGLAKVHPLGRAPVIRDGELVLAESGAIVEYLAMRYGGGRLIVASHAANYADYLFWLHLAPGTLMPFLMLQMTVQVGAAARDHGMIRHIADQLDTLYDLYENRLATVQYLAGNELTLADIMSAFAFTAMANYGGRDLEKYPNVRTYAQRLQSRPAYVRAMAIAGPHIP
jgi:glutathione S-transferase